MTYNSASSIFEGGRLKPGIYKIQNLYSEGYVDIYEHSKEMRCRSAKDLGEGRARTWEIKPLGVGYSIKMVEPGKPDQFCAPVVGLENDSPLSVAAYPVSWRIEVVDDEVHRGYEYVRLYWGATKRLWEIKNGTGAKVQFWKAATVTEHYTWWIWKLIPVKVEGASTSSETPGSSSLPPYDRSTTGQSSTHTQHAESERDDFGTIVTEVTTTSTVVTTRKKYRVEDAQ